MKAGVTYRFNIVNFYKERSTFKQLPHPELQPPTPRLLQGEVKP